MMFEQPDVSVALINCLGSSVESPNPMSPNMSRYPTPPSSSGDSPQPIYFVASPGSNNFIAPDLSEYGIQARIITDADMMNVTTADSDTQPRLVFIEQPTNKFRFRYRSEMAGTHGSLCGISSDKSRKQTYPTVELLNCSEKAVVRCSIYQHNVRNDFKPHPHRLIMKRGRDEYDDPHNLSVGPDEGFIASFHSMGIIHTARKNLVHELVRKLTQLKKEQIGRLEGKTRELTTKEVTDVALIIGIIGACHSCELYAIQESDIDDHGTALSVRVLTAKTKKSRKFNITGKYYDICKKYIKLRQKCNEKFRHNNPAFFRNYQRGKCFSQRMGVNKIAAIGRDIASYLELENPKSYTGNSFRQSSVKFCINAKGEVASLKCPHRWGKSTLEDLIDDSMIDDAKNACLYNAPPPQEIGFHQVNMKNEIVLDSVNSSSPEASSAGCNIFSPQKNDELIHVNIKSEIVDEDTKSECALTGDLKIVRMDHCTSPARGNKEIFVLVERVTKKNIKIRFFEVNDDDEQVWEGYGKFTELDVHHQYAIVFKTPEYTRDPNITSPVKVYMELVRPSDGATSEWKEFKYVPNDNCKPGTNKRARSSYYSGSSCYNSSSSLGSGEIPVPVQNMQPPQLIAMPPLSNNSWSGPILNNDEMNLALSDLNSTELQRLFDIYGPDYESACAIDAPREISNRLGMIRLSDQDMAGMGYLKNLSHFMAKSHPDESNAMEHSGALTEGVDSPTSVVKMEVAPEEKVMADRTYDELMSFIKTKDAQARAPDMLEKHLGEQDVTNALHVFVGRNCKDELTFLLKMIVLFKKTRLLNIKNSEATTPLQLAVTCRNEEFVTYLLFCDADPCAVDSKGRTALHVAVECMATPKILESLLAPKYISTLLEMSNYEGDTALFTAINKGNMQAIKILCLKGADVNKKHDKSGFTPLRMAIEARASEIVRYLLNVSDLNLHDQADFNGITPYAAAHESSPEIMDLITIYMRENGYALELRVKDEESDEEMEENEFEIKSETLTPDELKALYENVTKLTPECLDSVAAILDESHQYDNLADLLDLSHLISLMPSDQSISKNLLCHAIEREGVKVIDIRDFLANLDEHKAVEILDQMAMANKPK